LINMQLETGEFPQQVCIENLVLQKYYMTSIVYMLFLPRITILNQCPAYNRQSNNFHGTDPTTILPNALIN
jgi:hypothetical protein